MAPLFEIVNIRGVKAMSNAEVRAVFEDLCRRFGVESIDIGTKEIRKLLRKWGHSAGNRGSSDFIALYVRSMKCAQNRRLQFIDRERHRASKALVRKAAKADLAAMARSLETAPSRIAGEHEHLIVLAGLPAAKFYTTPEWRRSRVEALRLAGFRCSWCGVPSDMSELHVDHVEPTVARPERAFDLGNLRVLCEDCHVGRHVSDGGVR